MWLSFWTNFLNLDIWFAHGCVKSFREKQVCHHLHSPSLHTFSSSQRKISDSETVNLTKSLEGSDSKRKCLTIWLSTHAQPLTFHQNQNQVLWLNFTRSQRRGFTDKTFNQSLSQQFQKSQKFEVYLEIKICHFISLKDKNSYHFFLSFFLFSMSNTISYEILRFLFHSHTDLWFYLYHFLV